MSLTYGFYNSINEDRKYNASQMSKLFDGVLNDGIFMSIGDKFMVTANSGMNISVGTGRAWFNHTWTLNDSILVLPVSEYEILLNRIDVVVLEVNNTAAVRANSIKIIKGAGATVPVPPELVNTSEIHQYPLAHIYVGVGVTEILQANITNKVGLSETPFATGVMQGMNIDALVAQWQSEWDVWSAEQQADYIAWFNNINALLGTEPATNLQIQVTAIKDPPLDKATPVDVDYMVVADSTASNVFKKLKWANIKTTLKAYFDTLYNNYSHPTSDGNLHVPATGTTNNGKVLKAGATAGSLVWGTVDGYVHPTVEKTTPVDGDNVAISDSAASGALKKLTWANIKATLKTYFDTLYNNYTHPTSDGNSHVSVTGTTNGGKVLTAGSTANSFSWVDPGVTIAGDTAKTTPVDADMFALADSAASNVQKKLTFANLKATLKTYFDTLYALASHTHSYLPLSGGTLTGEVTSTAVSIIKGAYGGVPRGILYNDGSGMGFLGNTGNWALRVVYGSLDVVTGGAITAVGNVTAYSDARLKTNIVTIPNALDKVSALRGVMFDKDGVRNIGVIAQEVQKIIPEVVLEGTDEMKTLSVAYGNLVGLLIEAVKEQQLQIDELKAKVN